MDGNKLVTFFVLHEKEGVTPYSSNEQALLIRSFSTDFYEQGKGYAKTALQLLPDFVRKHFPSINELVLGVNVPNRLLKNFISDVALSMKADRRWDFEMS